VTIGVVTVTMTPYATSGSWNLGLISDATTRTGALVITPTGTAAIYSPWIFATAISSAAQAYYYNDILNNAGNVMGVKA
jgi:hypothetical protein